MALADFDDGFCETPDLIYLWTGKQGGGVEEKLQRQFEKMAEEEFGIDLKEAKAFEG